MQRPQVFSQLSRQSHKICGMQQGYIVADKEAVDLQKRKNKGKLVTNTIKNVVTLIQWHDWKMNEKNDMTAKNYNLTKQQMIAVP